MEHIDADHRHYYHSVSSLGETGVDASTSGYQSNDKSNNIHKNISPMKHSINISSSSAISESTHNTTYSNNNNTDNSNNSNDNNRRVLELLEQSDEVDTTSPGADSSNQSITSQSDMSLSAIVSPMGEDPQPLVPKEGKPRRTSKPDLKVSCVPSSFESAIEAEAATDAGFNDELIVSPEHHGWSPVWSKSTNREQSEFSPTTSQPLDNDGCIYVDDNDYADDSDNEGSGSKPEPSSTRRKNVNFEASEPIREYVGRRLSAKSLLKAKSVDHTTSIKRLSSGSLGNYDDLNETGVTKRKGSGKKHR